MKTELQRHTNISPEQAEMLLGELKAFVVAFSMKYGKKGQINGRMLKEISKSKHSEIEKLYLAYTLGFNLGKNQKG